MTVHRWGIQTALASLAVAGAVPFFAGPTSAQPGTEDEHADLIHVRVVSVPPAVVPGQRAWVGVHFDIQDGWHTYWPGQNDTGFGTTIEVKAPDGVTVSGPAWPAPHRHTMPGDILDHVHEGAVTAIFQVAVPEDAEVGSTVSIDFDLAWLVCKETCIPGWQSVTLELPVAASSASPPPPADAKIISDARARLPQPGAESFVTLHGATATLTAPGAASLAFYPDEASTRVTDLLGTGFAKGDTLTLTLESDDPTLSGVLEVWSGPGRPSALYRVHAGAGVAPETKTFE